MTTPPPLPDGRTNHYIRTATENGFKVAHRPESPLTCPGSWSCTRCQLSMCDFFFFLRLGPLAALPHPVSQHGHVPLTTARNERFAEKSWFTCNLCSFRSLRLSIQRFVCIVCPPRDLYIPRTPNFPLSSLLCPSSVLAVLL